ncbi:threonine aldolase family protein [Xylocopilactobacillus apicola]|uniref:Low specificity L-threonine aldolase n=1 Tax=Xylocopilactobacillus apicola TaxID=2932184 RepID=A0AAU9DQ01_9LACO|nr:low specificity L-threonine aldolase [Xylocopilactobacillus apicola]BDR59277.1 low specificity L-threonine aldolase [Xylocopilactobacillus apicola]
MISFENDYSEGAHPQVLERLVATNMVQEPGYGSDEYSKQAAQKIREVIECPEAQIRFLVGGTQTNQVVIDSLLTKYEGVIAAETGHVSVHEAGAIEYSGHKVLTIPATDGKISAQAVDDYCQTFYDDANHDHMVFPGMVYISYPTEYGTLYSKDELTRLAEVCHKYEMPLYIDGARLGYGLVSEESDLTIAELAKLCDVFYIGGTKVGALCGEAVVFTKNNEPKHFLTQIKQHGALLAKGRLIGVQFLELFSNNLYFDISRHAVELALKLKAGFQARGYQMYLDSPTNQQFVVLTKTKAAELAQKVRFSPWEDLDAEHQVVRFATSWATTAKNVATLLELI